MFKELQKYPKINLAFLPTPLVPLDRLSRRFNGPRIWMKRDDLTGLGLGGNKTRKLEFFLGDAVRQGADTLVTAGAVQSNHCRQTAAAAAAMGLQCHLLLGGDEQPAQGNLLLDKLFGAQIHWAGASRKGEDLDVLVDTLVGQGRHPYLIPYGGSNSLGALGFVSAMTELTAQTKALDVKVDSIVFASSSGGTHAGLIVGKEICHSEVSLVGIGIDKSPAGEPSILEKVSAIVEGTRDLLGLEGTLPHIELNESFMDRPYGECGELEIEAIRILAVHEGILLDPVYTGRAMGGFLKLLAAGYFAHQKNVVFWHTGGAPALFSYATSLA